MAWSVMPIRSLCNEETEASFKGGRSVRWSAIAKVAVRKLDMLDAAAGVGDLRSPPGNRLESLQGDRDGQHFIRINERWRICFVWTDAGPERVEIVDYH